jgi:hypothetical protein
MLAAGTGQLDVINMLLDFGANINHVCKIYIVKLD